MRGANAVAFMRLIVDCAQIIFCRARFGRFGSFSRSCLVSSAGFRKSVSTSTFFAMIVTIRPRTRLAVSRFSTQSEQFVNVAGLNLRDGEFPDRRAGVPFERRWPLITMLFVPGRPALANVDFGALLECGQSDLDLYGLRFLTRLRFS